MLFWQNLYYQHKTQFMCKNYTKCNANRKGKTEWLAYAASGGLHPIPIVPKYWLPCVG